MIIKRHPLSKAISIINYLFYIVLIIIVLDVFYFHNYLQMGYPQHWDDDLRYSVPYVEFIGTPNLKNRYRDHNEYGFRGPTYKESNQNDFKIAFFGGSTGYLGSPPIPNILEKELEKLTGLNVFVVNYSVVASNHRQHLHGIIEFLPQFKPDLVVFYGGYNETISSALYDPRPGYPYNYFYRTETSPFFKLLLKNSAIAGEIDKRTGVFSGLGKLKKEQQPYSNGWNKRIVKKYFETLMLANSFTSAIESQRFGKTIFFAFYQPYQVPKEFVSAHNEIKNQIGSLQYVFDVSSEYDILGEEIYYHNDIVHVNQHAKEVMGTKIAKIIAKELQAGKATIEKH